MKLLTLKAMFNKPDGRQTPVIVLKRTRKEYLVINFFVWVFRTRDYDRALSELSEQVELELESGSSPSMPKLKQLMGYLTPEQYIAHEKAVWVSKEQITIFEE